MLLLVLALISLNGMNATAAFVGIGLAYIFTALIYRLPVPVQPLKSVSSLLLALGLPLFAMRLHTWSPRHLRPPRFAHFGHKR